MGTRRFWLVAALVGVAAVTSCGNETQTSSGSGGDHAAVTSSAAPAKATPAPAQQSRQREGQESAETHEGQGTAPVSFDSPPPVGTRARCPVMGHDFVVTESTPRSEYNGRFYVFCCPACKPRFDANPNEFLAGNDQHG